MMSVTSDRRKRAAQILKLALIAEPLIAASLAVASPAAAQVTTQTGQQQSTGQNVNRRRRRKPREPAFSASKK